MKLDLILIPFITKHFLVAYRLECERQNFTILKENKEKYLYGFKVAGGIFLRHQKFPNLKKSTKFRFIKIMDFFSSKDPLKKVENASHKLEENVCNLYTDREFLQKVKDETNNPTSEQAGDINRYFTKEKINEEYELGKRKLSHTNAPLDGGTEMPHAPRHDPKKRKNVPLDKR